MTAFRPSLICSSKQLGFSDANIGLLQAIYSIPNVFMVLIGGYIVDRMGTRKGIFIFGTICLLGSIVTILSGRLAVMATGRLIFGLGAESLIVAVTTAVAKWFRGKELSFAFGINMIVARLGTWLAQNSPTWAHSAYSNWRSPLLISVLFATFCVTGAVIYWAMEVYAEKNFAVGKAGSTDKVVLSDVLKFGVSYWYIVALCIVFYSAIFPFETFAIKFFMEAHGTSRELGGFLVSILTAFTMFGTPTVWPFCGPPGQARTADDVRVNAADSRLPDDGLHAHQLVRSHGHDGRRLLADSGRDLALGGVYRGPVEAGNRLWDDDHDSEHRIGWLESAGGMGQ